jgi:hypothetical protein
VLPTLWAAPRCLDAQTRTNGESVPELLSRVVGIARADLDSIQAKPFLNSFDPDCHYFGELPVVVFDLAFHSFAGKHLSFLL